MSPLFLFPRPGWALAACSAVILGGWAVAPARAQVRSLTLGIHVNCPYGLAG